MPYWDIPGRRTTNNSIQSLTEQFQNFQVSTMSGLVAGSTATQPESFVIDPFAGISTLGQLGDKSC